jgi:hypothetical protein
MTHFFVHSISSQAKGLGGGRNEKVDIHCNELRKPMIIGRNVIQ